MLMDRETKKQQCGGGWRVCTLRKSPRVNGKSRGGISYYVGIIISLYY